MTRSERKQAAIVKAERDIKAIIIALQNDYGIIVDSVDVDTRNFTYGNVSIITDDDEVS